MALDYATVDKIIDIVQFFLMALYVGIAFYKYMTMKYEGKRDKVRLLLLLTFVMFFTVNIHNVYQYSQGHLPSAEFGFLMRNWAQVFMFMMVFEVLHVKYLYYSVMVLVLYVQFFFPSLLDPLSTVIGVVSMILMLYIGIKYKAGKLIGLALMGILGFLIIFPSIIENALLLIIAFVINDVYKLLFIADKINFFKKDKKSVSEDSQKTKIEVENK